MMRTMLDVAAASADGLAGARLTGAAAINTRISQNWPTRGRLPVYVTYGEPMRAEDGETVAQFSERIT